MKTLHVFQSLLVVFLTGVSALPEVSSSRCRTEPGDPGFPNTKQLSQFNASIDGRLITVIPSGQFCHQLPGGCSSTQFQDTRFREVNAGSMFNPNWEQDYTSRPSSLCFVNSTTCGQGNVPIFGVNATTVAHIQAGVRFAQAHNLKLVIKASGHDFLGRSTARNSFLIWTSHLQNITFHDSFQVGNQDLGSAVTAGSGVRLNALYPATKAQGKIYVGGTAATVVAAGGYVQGAGHSALSPLLGLAADNAIEFQIVLANGNLVTANAATNSDLFWALRGGGAGSWGVIVSATFKTFPTFNAVHHQFVISTTKTADIKALASIHAKHIFDWDKLQAAQFFYWRAAGVPATFTWTVDTVFPKADIQSANSSLSPLLQEIAAHGFNVSVTSLISASINDILFAQTDISGFNQVMGSRLLSDDVYRQKVTQIGDVYQQLFDSGAKGVLGHLVAGGQVSKNANISSAIHPKWRTAKTHVIVTDRWDDSATPDQVATIKSTLTGAKIPLLAGLAGPGSASYSNEADVQEPDFRNTFYGPNYPRLSAIKAKYDPQDVFIVPAGVGSERWDRDGLCRI